MTIIAAIESKDGTWIGSDTLLSAGNRLIVGEQKWFVWRGWAIALAGDWRVANILSINKERLLSSLKDENDFVDRLYALFEEKEIGRQLEQDFARNFGQSIILAKKNGPVWDFDCHLSTSITPYNTMIARGTGSDFALGASFALGSRISTEKRLTRAIEAAMEHCLDCGGDIFLKKL